MKPEACFANDPATKCGCVSTCFYAEGQRFWNKDRGTPLPPQEREELRAEVIRECIAALPKPSMAGLDDHTCHASLAALEALLPKPDKAKELVAAWFDETLGMTGGTAIDNNMHFARWLITEGHIQP